MTATFEQPQTVEPKGLPASYWGYVASRLISVLGDRAALGALAIFVYQRDASAVAVAGLFIARVLPRLAGPLTGQLADRIELRRLLRVCDSSSAAIYGLIAWWRPPYFALLVLVLLAELCAATVMPAARTAVPRMVPSSMLAKANSMMMVVLALGLSIGVSLGGLLVARVGAPVALAVNAASFALSAALVSFAPRMPAEADRPSRGRVWANVGGNFRQLWDRRGPGYVAAILVTVFFSAALDRTALVFLTQRVLRGGPGAYGLVLAVIGLGALFAAVTMRAGWLSATFGVLTVGVVTMGLAHVAAGFAPSIWLVGMAMFFSGFGNGLESVSSMTLIQRATPGGALGGVTGTLMTTVYLADSIGSAASAGLMAIMSPREVFWFAGALMLAGATLIRWRSRTDLATD